MRLLIVARDNITAAGLRRDLTKAGWHVDLSDDASDSSTSRAAYDAVLVMTDKSGDQPGDPKDEMTVGDLVVEPGSMKVSKAGRSISLTLREFRLLEFLMRNAGRVMSRDSILGSVWGLDYVGVSNVVDVYIGYLRRKIDKPFGSRMIRSVRGVGYILVDESADTRSDTVVLDDSSVLGA